jgi:hypothetical protein
LPDPEAVVKADVGAPSLMQQDGMDLAGAVGTGEGLDMQGLAAKGIIECCCCCIRSRRTCLRLALSCVGQIYRRI